MTIGEKMERLAEQRAEEERLKGIRNTVLAMRIAGTDEEKIRQIVSEINELSPEQYDAIVSKIE